MHKLALWLPYKKTSAINENPTNSSKFCTALLLPQKKKKKNLCTSSTNTVENKLFSHVSDRKTERQRQYKREINMTDNQVLNILFEGKKETGPQGITTFTAKKK